MVMPLRVEESLDLLREISNEKERAFIKCILDEVLRNMIHLENETNSETEEKLPKADVDFFFLTKVLRKFLHNKKIHDCESWLAHFICRDTRGGASN